MATLKLARRRLVVGARRLRLGRIHETGQRPYNPKGATATLLITAGKWFSGGVR